MANPQTENGHTQIANELLEAIYKTPMSDYEHRIFWLILRKTYGFKKKSDWISQSQMVKELNIYKSHISRTIRKLIKRNLVTKNNKMFSIQKDYEMWKLPKEVTNEKLPIQDKKLPVQVTKVTNIGNKKLPIQADTKEKKETYTKDTIQKRDINKIIIPYKEIEELFISICISFPKIMELTKRRKIAIRSRYLKYKDINVFKELFRKAEKSDFLSGRDGKWTSCNFDWLLNENNMIKVLEGNYNKEIKFEKHIPKKYRTV